MYWFYHLFLGKTDEKSVKILSADELKDVSIEDIVYPLPGSEVQFPDNIIAEWYEEILEEHGVEFEPPDNRYK